MMSPRTLRSVVLCAPLFLSVPELRSADFTWVPKGATGTHTIVGQEIILAGDGQQVTLDLEMSGWDPEQDNNPLLVAFQATVDSSGYINGIGTALNPLGWPGSPELGAFQILNRCTVNLQPDPSGAPCVDQADCPQEACIDNFDFVFQGLGPLAAISTAALDYAFAAVAQFGGRADDGTSWYGATLVIDVPLGAAGTYTIGFVNDPNNTFMTAVTGVHITPINVIPVLITVGVCEVDADCNNGNACTDDSCDPGGRCVATNNTNPCDDGDLCTADDTCMGGACVGGPPPDCDDLDPCTADHCDPGTGLCVSGPPLNCNDGNACTDDSCDSGSGCVNTNNTNPCDDGDLCTAGDTCMGGACIGEPPPNCDDLDPCTADHCDPGTGLCVNDAIVPCCGDGFCDPGQDQCNCTADCGSPPATETDCADGTDEDCDGDTDCADADCSDAEPCAVTCSATNVGTLTWGSTIVGSTIGSADDFVAGCGSQPGGQDEIFEFTVDFPGVWYFDTCTVPACWDTTLEIREETGGGCPGDFVACDGDGCNVCYYDSLVAAFLVPSSTYYLIVDGWSYFAYGDFTITAGLYVPGCTSNADCSDGLFCNGAETCDVTFGQCEGGSPPCLPQDTCNEDAQRCDPDPCITWRGGPGGQFFAAQANLCPDTANWIFEDIQTDKHTSQILDWYTTPLLARSTESGASPLGTIYSVDQALWTVEAGTCLPSSIIAGTECTNSGVVAPDGSPPDLMRCEGTMAALPDNHGDFNRCEIDFFNAYRTAENGAGFWFPEAQETIGGPAGSDDFGIDIVMFENCPPTGIFSYIIFPDDPIHIADFAAAEVCQKPAATCCEEDGSCSILPPSECMGVAGEVGTIADGPASCGGDPDGDGLDNSCGDNCPDDFNPDQVDCDGDGEGDACEADPRDQDDDGDGVCNFVDNCPTLPNPGQEDTDGDGAGDPCDPCPIDPNDDSDGDGVCDSADLCPGGDDRFDDDLDGVPNDCDVCPGSDDNVPGATNDADGDGVLNCNDRCPDADDTVFAPECEGAIPTTSHWGMVVLTLLLLAGGKIYFGGRRLSAKEYRS